MTDIKRRSFMKGMVAIGATMTAVGSGLLRSGEVLAAANDPFEAENVKDALQGLFGTDAIESSDKIKLNVPDVAENGAVVPVTVSTDMQNVESIAILADENVTPLVATFALEPRAVAYAGVRIKMAKTSNVVAVVKANGKLFKTQRAVKVTIGGCGG